MLRSRVHPLVDEHIVEGVGILVRLHQSGKAVADGPGVPAAFSQAPAQLYAVMLGNDTAFARFPAAGTVHVPVLSQALVRHAVFRNGKLADGHGAQIADRNVELRTGLAGFRLPHLGDPGAAVLLQLNPGIYVPDSANSLSLSQQAKRQAYKNQIFFHQMAG